MRQVMILMRIAVAIMMTNKERRKRLVRQAQIIKKILLRKKNATKKVRCKKIFDLHVKLSIIRHLLPDFSPIHDYSNPTKTKVVKHL